MGGMDKVYGLNFLNISEHVAVQVMSNGFGGKMSDLIL